jgi:hypothetical protein
MNIYLVERTEEITWVEDYAMVVIAEDEKHAERRARWESRDFKRAKNLLVKKVDVDKEQSVLIANTGA